MEKPQSRKYAAGFRFIVSTPLQTPSKHDRKTIRSHATRASVTDRQTVQLRSWISPGRKIGSLQNALNEGETTLLSDIPVPSPKRVGAAFSGLQLPPGVEPHMIQSLVKLIDLGRHGVYPYEICFKVHVVDRGWFPYMISDICCLHSMMFSVRAFLDSASHDQLSRIAYFHYVQTLKLLQARLNEFDKTSAISDATIMVVVTLASIAELTGDFAAVGNHINGLEKIVSLRGGVRALNTHNNLQVKVCRADLQYAMLSGHRPLLLKEGISWDCFIADRGLVHCSHQPHEAIIRAFVETTVDARLDNVLRDLHSFSCISNLAYETTRKLSPDLYNEIMISIIYRLTHLSFESDFLQESVRIGLMAFSSAIFMQRDLMGRSYDRLLNTYSNALSRLRQSMNVVLPTPLVLWLTMLSHLVAPKKYSPADWQSVWLDEIILNAGIDSWARARELLRSVIWVGFIHDRSGKQAFEAAMFRLQKEHDPTSGVVNHVRDQDYRFR